MYIRTRDGLGQGQATWSTRQTFNRPAAQPTAIGYLGHFNEPMGQTESKPCWDCYETAPCWARFRVENFKAASAELTDVIRKDIEDIAIAIIRILHRILQSKSVELKKRKTSLAVMLQLKGHLSKATDPENKSLDLDRAKAVAEYLSTQLSNEWSRQGLGRYESGTLGCRLQPTYKLLKSKAQPSSRNLRTAIHTYTSGTKFINALNSLARSEAGSTRPVSSDSKKNRRVVVCLRWEIESP